jgi:hypothetical protein
MPRATLPFTLAPCTVHDGPALAQNNIPAFFTIPNWRLIWTRLNKSCSYVTSQAVLRYSYNLLSEPERKRHQKVVDKTGMVCGYCRWVLPEGVKGGDEGEEGERERAKAELWAEAKVESVSEEEEERLKRQWESADWVYDHALDVLDGPQQEIKERLMGRKNYFRESLLISLIFHYSLSSSFS